MFSIFHLPAVFLHGGGIGTDELVCLVIGLLIVAAGFFALRGQQENEADDQSAGDES